MNTFIIYSDAVTAVCRISTAGVQQEFRAPQAFIAFNTSSAATHSTILGSSARQNAKVLSALRSVYSQLDYSTCLLSWLLVIDQHSMKAVLYHAPKGETCVCPPLESTCPCPWTWTCTWNC